MEIVLNMYFVKNVKLTINELFPRQAGLWVECRVWPQSVKRYKYLKVWSTLTNWPLHSESSAQWKFREGESWNLADTQHTAHLAEFIYCTELWRLGRGRAMPEGDRSRQTVTSERIVNSEHRIWSVPLRAHSSPGGNFHKLKCGQFCDDNDFIESNIISK